MEKHQGDVSLLSHPLAQELLSSRIPARLAYAGTDGDPRVVPIWFHWNGSQLVMGTPPTAPKVAALSRDPRVAVTIDTNDWPYKVLQIRGRAQLETVEQVGEYALAAERYFGPEQGPAWVKRVRGMFSKMVRISVTPEKVVLIDFQERFPSAIEKAMERE